MLPGKNIKLACSEFSVLIGLTIALTGCGGGSTSAPPQPQIVEHSRRFGGELGN